MGGGELMGGAGAHVRGGGRAHLKVFEQIAIYNKHNDISKIEDQTRKSNALKDIHMSYIYNWRT